MSRHVKWVAAGVYLPTQRTAYSPRWYGRAPLLEDFKREIGDVIHAASAPPGFAQRIAVPMPRGGVRWLLICSWCHERTVHLYGRCHPSFVGVRYACRRCWGLHYTSQYEGRRLEAHPEYLSMVMQRLREHKLSKSSKRQPTHELRLMRFHHALTRYAQRRERHERRCDIAEALMMAILVARSDAQARRRWQRILHHLLAHGDATDRQMYAELVDTPQWVRSVLLASLANTELHTRKKMTRNPDETIKAALEEDETTLLGTLIDRERLNNLRTAYAALGQPRHAKSAA